MRFSWIYYQCVYPTKEILRKGKERRGKVRSQSIEFYLEYSEHLEVASELSPSAKLSIFWLTYVLNCSNMVEALSCGILKDCRWSVDMPRNSWSVLLSLSVVLHLVLPKYALFDLHFLNPQGIHTYKFIASICMNCHASVPIWRKIQLRWEVISPKINYF